MIEFVTEIEFIDNGIKKTIGIFNDDFYGGKRPEKLDREWLLYKAVEKQSKLNATELLKNKTVLYLENEITGAAVNLQNAPARKFNYQYTWCKKLLGNQIGEAIKFIAREYLWNMEINTEWYRLARENKLISQTFTDGYCDETTFFISGVGEPFYGNLKEIDDITKRFEGFIDVGRIDDFYEYGGNHLYVLGCLELYAYHVADLLLITNLNKALDYLVWAGSIEHYAGGMNAFEVCAIDGKKETIQKARDMARAKHAKDPKQKAKIEILGAWESKREVLIVKRGKAQFCRDMQNQYKDKDGNDLIKDVKTISTWITDFERTVVNIS